MDKQEWPTGKKSYRMEVDTFGMPTVDMDVTIDFDRMTEAEAREHVFFWMDGKGVVRECGGSIVDALLKRVCQFAISFAVLNDYNACGVTKCFEEEEGWFLDEGVVVFTGLSVEWQPPHSDMEITAKD